MQFPARTLILQTVLYQWNIHFCNSLASISFHTETDHGVGHARIEACIYIMCMGLFAGTIIIFFEVALPVRYDLICSDCKYVQDASSSFNGIMQPSQSHAHALAYHSTRTTVVSETEFTVTTLYKETQEN